MATDSIKILSDFAKDVVSRAQRNIGATSTYNGKKRRIESSGQLRNSLTFSIKETGRGKTYITFGAKGAAGKYADVVEDGRRPGKFPPPDAIKTWMKVKPIRLRNKLTNSFVKQTDSAINSAAFLIARSISKKGIKGTKFFESALKEQLDINGDQHFVEVLDDIVARITPVKR
jgi:hypothetical protein